MRKLFSLVLLLACGVGLLPAQEVAKPYRRGTNDLTMDRTDRLTGFESVATYESALSGVGRQGRPGVSVSWVRLTPPEGDARWFVRVVYSGTSWAFIEESPAIDLLVDGERLTLMAEGRAARRTVRGGVVEVTVAELSPEALFRIARADSVYWRVNAERLRLEGDASPSNFERLRRFLATLYPDSTIYVRD